MGLGFGVAAVVVVVADVEVAGVVAAALVFWLVDVEDAAPHALTTSVRRTAASGMRSCLMWG